MKTVMQWLQEAKEQGHPWADAAIANCVAPDAEKESMHRALLAAFIWDDSIQGNEYWRRIYRELGGRLV
jgi:hypothetical protein